MEKSSLQRSVHIGLLSFIIVAGLYFAKPFLVPVCLAGIFAMLFLLLSRKLEERKVGRGWSTLFCLLIFLVILGGIALLMSWQINNLVSDLGNIKQKIHGLKEQVTQYISDTLGISPQKQEEAISQQNENGGSMIM
ncbi:MAG: AI-2E family transporter, partial [Bacteroidota bacterium]|nr:AI-2E family transporter [Bacteroidota bacterium]